MPTKKPLSFEGVQQFLRTLFADDLPAKRVLSLAGATLGAIASASLAVAMIGQGLALARGRLTKHAIPLDALASGKQVDWLLSNPGIDVDALLVHWVPYGVGSRSSITVAMDWTDFDADGQTTIMLPLLCRHARATPLVWLTADTATLKDRCRAYEDQVLMRLAEVLPAGVRVRIVADRGFGDQKLYRMLTDALKFDFVIRFRGTIKVTAADGEARPAAEWVGAGGRARVPCCATVTAADYPLATVVCVQARDMKQPSRALRVLPPEDRFAMVPGRQRHPGDRPGAGQPLRQAMGHRGRVPRRHRRRRSSGGKDSEAVPGTCASAWGWARCTSAPPTGATACG